VIADTLRLKEAPYFETAEVLKAVYLDELQTLRRS